MATDAQTPNRNPSVSPPLPQRKGPEQPKVLRDVRQHRSYSSFRTIGALVLREMQRSNDRVAGGYFWAIAEPVGGIILLTLIFSAGFRSPPLGTNFAIFYATGMVPFAAYLDITSRVSSSIQSSRPLLAYPAVTFMDALLATIVFQTITQIMVWTLIFTGMIWFMDTRTDPQIEQIALAFLMMIAVSLAVGSVNCFLFSAFTWWQKVWGIIMRPLFIASCIFFIFDDVPQPYQDYLWWNPLVHIVGQARYAFYPSYSGDYISYTYVFGLSLGIIALGLALLVRYHRDLQNS